MLRPCARSAEGARRGFELSNIPTLEQLFTSREAFAIETATPTQRAICRALDGLPLGDLWQDEGVRESFADVQPLVGARPKNATVLGGVRGAKSTLIGAAAVHRAITCDVSGTKAGDQVRIPVLSVDKDTAGQTFAHIANNLSERPALRRLMVGEPKEQAVRVRHPSGKVIEIRVVALAKWGGSMTARWFASVLWDEAPRMVGEADGVRNLTEARRAARARILPGGQAFSIGSPYQPDGPVYTDFIEGFGKPTLDRLVVRARGWHLNPYHWTPEKCAYWKEHHPDEFRTDVEAEFADPEEGAFATVELERAIRSTPFVVPAQDGFEYAAAMDPATRGNAWTFGISACTGLGGPGGTMPVYELVFNQQWIGSKARPLNPDVILGEMAERCREYRVDLVWTDQHAFDAMLVIAERHGLTLSSETANTPRTVELCEELKVLIGQERFRLSPDPFVKKDLQMARKRLTPNGYRIVLPRSAGNRHCDYVPTLLLLAGHPPSPPVDAHFTRDPRLERAIREIDERKSSDPWERMARRFAQ